MGTRMQGPTERSAWRRYAAALALGVLALLATLLFESWLAPSSLPFFFAAVALSAWYGGLGPGLLTTLVATLSFDLYLVEPRGEFRVGWGDLPRLAVFSLVAALIGRLTSARQRAERALRASRDELAVILSGVVDGVTAQDATGRLIYVNDAAARTLGYDSPAAVLATPLPELMRRFELRDEAGRPFPLERLPGRLALQGVREAEATLRFRDLATGEERWSVVNATPVLDERGGSGSRSTSSAT